MARDELDLKASQLADLSALADGSIDPRRREEAQAWVDSSPELQELYQREKSVLAVLARARTTDRAPDRLRSRIERESQRSSRQAPWRRRRLALMLAVPIGAAVAILALALPTGTPGGPSLSQAAALAARGPAQGPPAADPRDPTRRLAEGVQDLYFPNWARGFGWRAVGQRRDAVGGRQAVTVYYARKGHLLAYTIIGGPGIPEPDVPVRTFDGLRLQALTSAGRTIVTWRREGHTCVLSTRGVPVSDLQHLAAWRNSAR